MIGPKKISIKSEIISKDTDKDGHDVGKRHPNGTGHNILRRILKYPLGYLSSLQP